MRLRGNEEYSPKEIESKEFWSIMMIPNPYGKIWENEKEHVSNKREFFLGIYDE